MTTDYDVFLQNKIRQPKKYGFEPVAALNKALFEWQALVVRWGLEMGRCAFFEDCGLGKSFQMLEWAHQIHLKTGGDVIILTPLAVAEEMVEEGKKFGIIAKYCREDSEVEPGITVTNYECIDAFNAKRFVAVSLDESSILKNLQGKTRIKLTELFVDTLYKLCCTATPSPNDFTELGQHAEFLGVCKASEMLATWFVNDTQDTGTWRLKGHAEEDFWKWVSSWAACVTKPSDLGFSDDGYILPELKMNLVTVLVDHTEDAVEGEMFRHVSLSATTIHEEGRRTCGPRAQRLAQIVNACEDQFLIYCNTDYEAKELRAALPDLVEIKGSDSPEKKRDAIKRFKSGEIKRLLSKPSIIGMGLNLQHCWNVAFVGLSYSFEQLYQALRRLWRFGQTHIVNCYIVQADTEGNVMRAIMQKKEQHDYMRTAMRFSAETILGKKEFTIMKTTIDTKSEGDWTIHHGDAYRAASLIKDNSVGFSVFSPPFDDLFVYSNDVQDMGNCKSPEEFFKQFNFVINELLRVTIPGRLCAVHCLDLMSSKWKHGKIELKDFSGQIMSAFASAGWLRHSRITIWKDPVVEMQRTKALGLLHKQLLKDSAMSRVGNPEYILVFRKDGENPLPISHTPEEYPVELWQKDASPVWMDIDQTDVLNGHLARENNDERHICPLQLDVINRCLRLWSRPGDLVYSPYGGIGSEGFCALKMGRRFVASELKPSYFDLMAHNLKRAVEERRDLFALNA